MSDRNSGPNPQNGDFELNQPQAVQTEARTEQNNTPPNNAVNNNYQLSLCCIKRSLIFSGVLRPVVTHWIDLGSDIWLLCDHFTTRKICYGWLTLAFIIIPLIICTCVSFRMFEKDDRSTAQTAEENENSNFMKKVEKLQKNIIAVFLGQLLLPLRYLRIIHYAWKVLKYKQNGDEDGINEYSPKLLEEQEGSALVYMIECFLETAPQLVLQLTVLPREDEALTTAMWFKIFGGCVALLTLGWSMRTYHCAIRSRLPDKPDITCLGSILLFLGHLGTIAARIFLIGIAVSKWPGYTLGFRAFIFICWTAWLCRVTGNIEFCQNESDSSSESRTGEENQAIQEGTKRRTVKEKIWALLFAAVLAVVYMFTYVNVETENPRVNISTYYVLYVIENVIVIALRFSYADQTIGQVWFTERGILIFSIISLVIGISAIIIYCHRDNKITAEADARSREI